MDEVLGEVEGGGPAPSPFFNNKAPPDPERIGVMLERLQAFVEDPATPEALARSRKDAALRLQAFLVEQRSEKGAMPALRDAIAIISFRRRLTGGMSTPGPFIPLVQIAYPDLKQSGYYAIAKVLSKLIGKDVQEAERKLRSKGGVDAMNRTKSKPKSQLSTYRPAKPRNM